MTFFAITGVITVAAILLSLVTQVRKVSKKSQID